jgi:hypothetical protein
LNIKGGIRKNMERKGKQIFLLLFIVMGMLYGTSLWGQATAIHLTSSSPKFSSNTKQVLQVTGNIDGLADSDLPVIISVVDNGSGDLIGTATATANPFSILVAPTEGNGGGVSAWTFPTGATTEFYIGESNGGNVSSEIGKIYVNDQPLRSSDLTVNINPIEVKQGDSVLIGITTTYPMKRTGLIITVTDSEGNPHIIPSSSITYL